jgi:hypothetical protein
VDSGQAKKALCFLLCLVLPRLVAEA